ncbi:Gfo/Idh/MocA family protein [Chloroflexota bacterium]
MSKNYVKVGIVGCGFITQNTHIPAFRRAKGARIVALCDTNESIATNIARKQKIPSVYTSLTNMLEKEQLDLVDICTPIETHANLSVEALEANCHVLVEKPLALTASEAEHIVKIANKKNKALCVAHNMLFLPIVMKMKKLVEEGFVGHILKVQVVQGCPPEDFPPVADPSHWYHRLPGGIHGDNLPHPLYIARHFIGDMDVVQMDAYKTGSLEHLEVDTIQIALKGNNSDAVIMSSCNMPSIWTVDILGTKNTLHANLINSYLMSPSTKTLAGKGIPALYAMQNIAKSMQIIGWTARMGLLMMQSRHTGHTNLIRSIVESINSGSEPPITAQDGLEITCLWEKITEQIPTGKRSV